MSVKRMMVTALVLAWVLTGACKSRPTETAPTSMEPRLTPIEIGYSALRISLPIFVAQERGLFRRQGLDVTLKRYDTAQPMVEEILDGRIQAAGYAALPIIFTAAARGKSTVRLATLMQEDVDHPVSYLLKRAGDASIKDAAGLKGKKVGILPTTAYVHWLDAVVRAAGLQSSDVTAVPIAPALQGATLREGGVDALFTNDPMATAAIVAGIAQPIGEPGPVPRALGGPVLFGAFLLSDKLATERPTVAAGLVAALDEAIGLIEADQAAARGAMAAFVRVEERAFLDRYPPARYLQSALCTDEVLMKEAASELAARIVDTAVDVRGWAYAPGTVTP